MTSKENFSADNAPVTPTPLTAGATKFDAGKPPLSIIPRAALNGMAAVFAFGAKKYGRNNYKKGMQWTRLLDAAMRHLTAIADGEDNDLESGHPHWAHALCCVAMYAYYATNKVGEDDR